MNPYALVVGEALVDVVRRKGAPAVEYVGGSPLNVAVGLGRLERPVRFVTGIGRDPRGTRIADHLAASGVHLEPESVTAERTASAIATIDGTGAATYDFDITWDPVLPEPNPSVLLVHTGSIAAVLEPGCEKVADLVAHQAPTATVSFDPNVRPALVADGAAGRARIDRLVETADVVKVSDEDLAWYAPGRDPVDVAQDWLSRGPAIVAVTHGGKGAFALCRAGDVTVDVVRVEVIDTVGAGDAFTTGLLDALWSLGLLGAERRGDLRDISVVDLRWAMDIAAVTAGLTVARAGADLPSRDERDRAVRG